MLTSVIFLFTLALSDILPPRCSHPSGTLTGEIELEPVRGGGGERVFRTVISTNIGLDETLCFRITYNYTAPSLEVKSKTVLYTLEYDNLKHVYNFKNSYDFAIPATEMTCWCDCPGGSNHCDSDTDSCGKYDKNEETCVNWYEDGQTLDGCLWLTGSGQSCCNLDIVRFSADTYKAVEIASPVTQAQLRLNVIDVDVNPPVSLVKDRIYNVDLDSGTSADDLVTLNIATSSTSSLLPAGWYFGRTGSAELKTNVKVNGLNEWDMNKLGWYKIQHGFETIRKGRVRGAFSAATQNCGESRLDTNFAAAYYNRYPNEAETVQSYMFSKVDRVIRNDSARQVIAYHRSSPLLDIKLTFNEKSNVIFIYDHSYLEDFVGNIILDKFSNRYLNITLLGGTGSIVGTVKSADSEGDSFYIYIPTKTRLPYQKFVMISSTCAKRGDGKQTKVVCVKPLGPDSVDHCKQIVCTEDKNTKFVLPEDEIAYERAEHDDILSLATWGKYLNPIQWFKGGKPGWVEGIVITVFFIVLAIVVGILVKVLKMFGCLFKCLTCCGLCKCDKKDNKFWIDKKRYFRRRKESLHSVDSENRIKT